jgi:hypothetical protein
MATYIDQGEAIVRGTMDGECVLRDTFTNLRLAVDQVRVDDEEHLVDSGVLVRAEAGDAACLGRFVLP